MNETEKALFTMAVSAVAFIVGFHVGAKRAAQAQQQAAAMPVDHMSWFTQWGGFNR